MLHFLTQAFKGANFEIVFKKDYLIKRDFKNQKLTRNR